MQTVIGVVAGVAVVVAAVVLLGRRRPTDTHSVRGYRQTMSTLEHLQERPRHERAPEGAPPRALTPRADRQRVPARPMAPLPPRRAERSLAAMNHGSRRFGAPLVVVVVLAALIGSLLYVGLRTHHPKPSASRSTDTSSTHHTSSSSTTTTTAPAPPARYTAVTTTTTSATYAPVTTTYTLLVGASSGSCWMSITNANGTTVMAQALTSGSTRSISLTGKATVLIGAPTVASLKIDNVPAVLPTGALAPFTVTLVPAG